MSQLDIKNRPIFTEEDINRLELQAVQKAQVQLIQNMKKTKIQSLLLCWLFCSLLSD